MATVAFTSLSASDIGVNKATLNGIITPDFAAATHNWWTYWDTVTSAVSVTPYSDTEYYWQVISGEQASVFGDNDGRSVGVGHPAVVFGTDPAAPTELWEIDPTSSKYVYIPPRLVPFVDADTPVSVATVIDCFRPRTIYTARLVARLTYFPSTSTTVRDAQPTDETKDAYVKLHRRSQQQFEEFYSTAVNFTTLG